MNPLTILLFLTSSFLVILIFNQNENAKEVSQESNTEMSFFEQITWILLGIEFLLLLLKVKITDF